jgi:cytoskeletal protein CcmA (bactofilin family)
MRSRAIGWKRRALPEEPPRNDESPRAADSPPPGPEPERKRPKATRIEPGCEVDGVLSLEGPLLIEGEFRGEIRCQDAVTVLQSGTVEACIEARTVTIEGAVVGNVTATREVVIARRGKLHGDVVTPSLAIERGAFFQGATRMYRPEQQVRREVPREVETPVTPGRDAPVATLPTPSA